MDLRGEELHGYSPGCNAGALATGLLDRELFGKGGGFTHGVSDGKYIDRDNYDPPPSAISCMHAIRAIEQAHENRTCGQD